MKSKKTRLSKVQYQYLALLGYGPTQEDGAILELKGYGATSDARNYVWEEDDSFEQVLLRHNDNVVYAVKNKIISAVYSVGVPKKL